MPFHSKASERAPQLVDPKRRSQGPSDVFAPIRREIAGSDGELGNRTGHNMSDEDDLEEEDDEPGLLFGKRRDAESANLPDSSKRHKA